MIGWCNNWNYANDIPTSPWKSAFSLPRSISVKKANDEWLMIQRPIKAIDLLRTLILPPRNIVVDGISKMDVHGQQLQLHFNFHPFPGTIEGVRLAVGNDHYFEIGYDAANQKLYIDRSKTANQNFNPKFQQLSRYATMLSSKGNNIDLNIYFDNSIVEVFANDGEYVITTQIFPNKDENGIELFSNNGTTNFMNVNIAQMRSVWK
jgi:fructan beta-fructosidase